MKYVVRSPDGKKELLVSNLNKHDLVTHLGWTVVKRVRDADARRHLSEEELAQSIYARGAPTPPRDVEDAEDAPAPHVAPPAPAVETEPPAAASDAEDAVEEVDETEVADLPTSIPEAAPSPSPAPAPAPTARGPRKPAGGAARAF